jgi:DNA-directed RNA polymerase subunit M/transcription elongation factor TFIIS
MTEPLLKTWCPKCKEDVCMIWKLSKKVDSMVAHQYECECGLQFGLFHRDTIDVEV